MKLLFAQGNPAKDYGHTRHNVGFVVLDALAQREGAGFSAKAKFFAEVAEFSLESEKVLLVKPTTYYNETGKSARALIDFYKLDPASDVLVLHDDLALPFGTLRVRGQGSDAGNNGIKSLNAHIEPSYTRIRIGIWNDLADQIDSTDFVLSRFTKAEAEQLSTTVMPKSLELIDEFLAGTLTSTSHRL